MILSSLIQLGTFSHAKRHRGLTLEIKKSAGLGVVFIHMCGLILGHFGMWQGEPWESIALLVGYSARYAFFSPDVTSIPRVTVRDVSSSSHSKIVGEEFAWPENKWRIYNIISYVDQMEPRAKDFFSRAFARYYADREAWSTPSKFFVDWSYFDCPDFTSGHHTWKVIYNHEVDL